MKKTVLLVADVKKWAFDNIAQYLKVILSDKYEIHIIYSCEFTNPGKLLDHFNDFEKIDFIHFFYRGYLKDMLEHIALNKTHETKWKKFFESGITTSIPEHLYLMNEKEKQSYRNTFFFADYYYTISSILHDIYSKIDYYPKPWREVIFDNVIVKKSHPNFENNDKLSIAWVGNSAWGKHYFEKEYDPKGYFSVILPTFSEIEKDINIEKYIADGNQQKRSKEEIFEILQKTDILLISANTDGTPLPLIEAMFCGCAIITTHNGIAPEILPDIQKEFIVKKDPKEFIDAIRKINSDRSLLTSLKKANYKAFSDIFLNDDLFHKKWSNLIENTIKRSQSKDRIKEKINVLNQIANELQRSSFAGLIMKKLMHNQHFKKTIKFLMKNRLFEFIAQRLTYIFKKYFN